MPSKQIGEIIADVKSASTEHEKAAILLANRYPVIRELVKISRGVDAFVALPDSEPPYVKSTVPYPYNDARLYTAWKQFPLFRNERAKKSVVEMRFIQLLEALHADEAQILVDAHLGKFDLGLSVKALNGLFGLSLEEPAPEPETVPDPEPDSEAPTDDPKTESPKPKRGRKTV